LDRTVNEPNQTKLDQTRTQLITLTTRAKFSDYFIWSNVIAKYRAGNPVDVYIFLCELRDNNLIWMLECRCTKVASFIEQSSFQAEDYKNKKSLLSFIVKTKKYTSEYRAYEEKTKKNIFHSVLK
jgi:hypothetical protein